jgi:hypothetical protein
VAALLAYLAMTIRMAPTSQIQRALPAGLLALLTLMGASAVTLAVRRLIGENDVGLCALVGTLVMVAATIILAALRRAGGPVELRWIAWVTLASSGLKMLGQDLPAGRPTTLFLAFLALGAGVLALPRLLKEPRSPPAMT